MTAKIMRGFVLIALVVSVATMLAAVAPAGAAMPPATTPAAQPNVDGQQVVVVVPYYVPIPDFYGYSPYYNFHRDPWQEFLHPYFDPNDPWGSAIRREFGYPAYYPPAWYYGWYYYKP